MENIKRLEKTIAEKLDDEAWNDLQELYKYIKEREEALDNFMKGKAYSTKQVEDINKNYIPKSKIREKIEEINGSGLIIYEGGRSCSKTFMQSVDNAVIRILQELLEERRIKV